MRNPLRLFLLCASFGCYAGAPWQSQAQLPSVDTALRAGSEAFAKHDLPEAEAQFSKAARLAPRRAETHTALGTTLLAEGKAREAVAELTRALALAPADFNARLNLALARSAMGDYPAAMAAYDALSPKENTRLDSNASLAVATAMSATGRPQEAEQLLSAAIAEGADTSALHDALGAVRAQQGGLPEAVSEFRRAVKLAPTEAGPHFHLGSVALAQQDPEAALAELAEAHRLAPGNVQYATQLGAAQAQAGHDAEALATLREAVALSADARDAQATEARYQLALALQNGGDSSAALPYFRQTLAARPQDPGALINLALALVQTGDARRAIPLYQRAEAVDPGNPTLREDMGVAYLQQSDLDHAIDQFHRGLAFDRDNAHLHYDLGLALKLKDDLASAVPEFTEAERIDPELPDPPYTLGVIYMQQGRQADAQAELSKAVALRPGNGEAWSLLGNVLKDTGQAKEADAALRKAIALLPDQPSPHISLAALLSAGGDVLGAAAERKLAAGLSRSAVNRQRADFALDSGRVLLARGKVAEAIEQLRAAVAADPGYRPARQELATALERAGKIGEAAQERAKAATLPDAATHP